MGQQPIEGQLGVGEVVASLVVRSETLSAFAGPFDRSGEFAGRPSYQGLLGVKRSLRAEAATYVWRDHPELVLGNRQDGSGDQKPDHMWVLARRVQRIVARTAVVFADSGARLHGIGDEPVVDDVEARHVVRPGERYINRGPVPQLPIEADVVRCVGPV